MADFGLFCTNDSGTVQIDSTNVNFEVISTGSTSGPASGFTINSISFTSCPNPPMVFVRTTGAGYTYFMNWIMSGSNYVGAKLLVYGNITVNWFVAAPQFTTSSDTWGMHIFNPSGVKVFDSGKPYLKIIDAIRLGTPNAWGGITFTGPSQTISHATTPQPFYCVGGGNSYILDDGSDLWQCSPAIQSNGTSSVIINKAQVDTISNPGTSLSYTSFPSATFNNTGEDSIYQIPIIVGALGV